MTARGFEVRLGQGDPVVGSAAPGDQHCHHGPNLEAWQRADDGWRTYVLCSVGVGWFTSSWSGPSGCNRRSHSVSSPSILVVVDLLLTAIFE
jgi:hypothetical protein